ncbi:efflux RND transporter periplasmic adaptor subunit [Desulfonema magnum]|uniref:Efflux transporter, RND family n=1 Tax=Desulfonema magnum TaxID=45655 RepID=A0A975GPY0_9BACT|nr:efflux RND transporter periplasmic adaptor subunit [Desulfonema magnum]QTA89294.1 Efflux transporter, RND family [Desulfonema magnum]
MTHRNHQNTDQNRIAVPSEHHRIIPLLVKILLPLLILGAGIAGAAYIQKSTSKPRRRPPEQTARLVNTEPVRISDEQVVIQVMGTVEPAHELVLRPKVSGEVVSAHPEFTEGGFLEAGEEILKIDPKDYELIVTQMKSKVAEASYQLKIEMGYQDIAKREWELLNGKSSGKDPDKALATRKPHLEKAKAELRSAKAELEQARLNLARTRVCTPFSAVIRTKQAEIGSQVSSGEQLAELTGTDEYRIRVSVPVDRLKWITIPRKGGDPGSQAVVKYHDGAYQREGTVIRLLSDLDTEAHMARLLISVKDPLGLENPETGYPPLLIGEYVRVEIRGEKLTNVVRIPRTALRDDNKIWIAGKDRTLIIRQVRTVWRDNDSVFLKNGLKIGEQLITSDLSAPVHGMAIQMAGFSENE